MNSDICIVGGGLVGLAAAIAFSHQGRSVQLLEASNLQLPNPAELDTRAIALSYSTVQIFNALGLWHSLKSGAAPIQHIHVSSAGHFGVTRLNADDLRLQAMGYVVEYHHLLQHLLEHAKQDPNIEIISPARLLSLQQYDDHVSVDYQCNGELLSLMSALLVVADGAGSPVRDMLGISCRVMDYQQTALIANVKIQQPANGAAYERFTIQGPMALLPLTLQRYALVWTQPSKLVPSIKALTDEDFLQRIYQNFGYRLGYFSEIGGRAEFELKLSRAEQLVSGRCVLIGNAANTMHPVAGQGFNLALRDISQLFDCLQDVELQSAQLLSQLDSFPLLRKLDQDQTVQLGHGLVSLFSNDLPVLNHLRAGALAALDVCPLLKQEFSWQGMGYGDGCSSLMRGVD